MSRQLHIAYLFTTFPAKSETFLQREIECLRDEPIEISLFSLWGGDRSFKDMQVKKFNRLELLLFPILLIWSGVKHPQLFIRGLRAVLSTRPTSLLNLGENIVGLIFGLRYATHFKRKGFSHIHATWATMPTTAAIVISKMTGIPYSMGAHAYDIFKKNGDMFLEKKIKNSQFIHTSSKNAELQLIKKGADASKIRLIRRGLTEIPEMKKTCKGKESLKIISIGRLVEKKGFLRQLEIYKELKERAYDFHARIIGEGPLKKEIRDKIHELGLNEQVSLLPWMPYSELEKAHLWADVFLFTGKVAKDGDRDGLPNVIPEVMAKGVAIVTSDVTAIPEVIKNNENGILISNYNSTDGWCDALVKIGEDADFLSKITSQARKWVERHYNGRANARKLLSYFNRTS